MKRSIARRHAALLSLVAVAALALAGCGGSQEDAVRTAWLEFNDAMHDTNVPVAKSLMAAGVASELDGPQATLAMEMRSTLVPPVPEVTSIEVSDDHATVNVTGVVEGQNMTGRITMVQEAGTWKVSKEDWTVDMTASFSSPGVDLAARYADKSARPRGASEIAAHEGAVTALAYTRDGMHIVSIGYDDYHLRLWDAMSGAPADDIKLDARPCDLALSADGTAAFVVDAGGRITQYAIEWDGFGEPRPFQGLAGQTSHIAVDPQGHRAVTTSWNEPAKLWDIDAGTFVRALPKSDKMRGVAFSPVAPAVACGSYSNYFAVWNLEKSSSVKKHNIPKVDKQSDVWSVAYSPDGRRLATGHMDSSISLWNMETGKQMFNWYVTDASTMDVVFSTCGTVLATAQQNGRVHLWETETNKSFGWLQAHEGAALSVAFNPADGVTVATGGEDGAIKLWR